MDTPLCSFVYVTVNGEDWGLYLAVEAVEDSFMQRVYNGEGDLYKPDSLSMGGGGPGNGMDFNLSDFISENAEQMGFPFARTDSEEAAADTEATQTQSGFPSFSGAMPDMSGGMPDMSSFGGSMPDMSSGMPDMSGGMPDMGSFPSGGMPFSSESASVSIDWPLLGLTALVLTGGLLAAFLYKKRA